MGKIKHKGRYQIDGFGYHQNQSFLVIPKAAVACLLEGKDLEEFILNHDDVYDFLGRTKVPRSSKLVAETLDDDGYIVSEEQQQNICRYYISNDGVALTKVMPPLPDKPKSVCIYEKEGRRQYATTQTMVKRLEKNEWICVGETQERRISINTGQKVTICNNMDDYKGDINYEWYIEQAKKLVDPLIN